MFEMIRHAARSSNEDNVDSMEFFGVPKGHITKKGRIEAYKIGMKRKEEYIHEKGLLSTWKSNS